ncbi:TPA: thioredoxin domain-containing protein [Staphylococcus aureus]|nr:thioredoxin domain-containing protein [Staphylococcus aureus]HEO8862686.1 thioredoxin domain-containing protein [Staphylococcus aureus]
MKGKVVVALMVLVLIAGLVLIVVNKSTTFNNFMNPENKFEKQGKHAPTKGDEDAENTIYVLADFNCPYCKIYEKEIIPKLESNYLKNGKAKIKFLDAPLLGDDSVYKAVISDVIQNKYPNKYWEFNDRLYDNQKHDKQNKTNIDKADNDSIKKVLNNADTDRDIEKSLSSIGLNESQIREVKTDAESKISKSWERTIADRNFAKDIKIKQVPSVYVNGKKIEDYNDWKSYAKKFK